MTDSAAGSSPPKIPVFRTAYDAYRLCFSAIFGCRKVLRFFLYGTGLSLGIVGAIKYARLTGFLYLPVGAPWRIEINFALETLISIITLAGLAAAQAPMGIAIIRYVILREVPDGAYFSGLPGRRWRFFLLTVLVYFLFLLASLAFVPLALIHGINPIYRSDIMARAMETPGFLLEILLAWAAAGVLACMLSASLSFRFTEHACNISPQPNDASGQSRAPIWRLVLTFTVVLGPVAVATIAVYYAGIAFYIFAHWAAVESAASGSGLESLADNRLRSKEYLISNGMIVVCGAFAYVLIAAGAARAYQIRVERGLTGAAEVFS